jgi:hypothetical protein
MVEVVPIHVIGLAVSLLLLYQSVRLVRSRRENIFEFVMWAFFGTVLLVYTIARMVTTVDVIGHINAFLRSLGFGSGERGLLVLSVISLFLIVFYTYTMVKTYHREMTDLQQELAIARYEIEQLSDERHESTDGPGGRAERREADGGTDPREADGGTSRRGSGAGGDRRGSDAGADRRGSDGSNRRPSEDGE